MTNEELIEDVRLFLCKQFIWSRTNELPKDECLSEARTIVAISRSVRDSVIQFPSEEEFQTWLNEYSDAEDPYPHVIYSWLKSHLKTVQFTEEVTSEAKKAYDRFHKPIFYKSFEPQTVKTKRCPCGGAILADTEDFTTPLCSSCFEETLASQTVQRISDYQRGIEDASKYIEEYGLRMFAEGDLSLRQGAALLQAFAGRLRNNFREAERILGGTK